MNAFIEGSRGMKLENMMRALLLFIIYLAITMLITKPVLSNPMSQATSSPAIPYEGGGTDNHHSAVANITNVRCSTVDGDKIFYFDVEVFPTSWKSVYSVVFEDPEGASLEPVSCPRDWGIADVPMAIDTRNALAFSTETSPILPGTRLGSFGLSHGSTTMELRWYPADVSGNLVGKVTRQTLTCSARTELESWGAVKAMYR